MIEERIKSFSEAYYLHPLDKIPSEELESVLTKSDYSKLELDNDRKIFTKETGLVVKVLTNFSLARSTPGNLIKGYSFKVHSTSTQKNFLNFCERAMEWKEFPKYSAKIMAGAGGVMFGSVPLLSAYLTSLSVTGATLGAAGIMALAGVMFGSLPFSANRSGKRYLNGQFNYHSNSAAEGKPAIYRALIYDLVRAKIIQDPDVIITWSKNIF
ncbi:hypothetical protein HN587_02210 [Candidatus Woesearchaeota archaeon]|jgi:hypothetical protein|nr:hypothetical protein [Candidatus Woesearchaeota archaeon]